MNESPRCPKCGFVMCELFDEQRINEAASYAIPTGKYRCYHCDIDVEPSEQEKA